MPYSERVFRTEHTSGDAQGRARRELPTESGELLDPGLDFLREVGCPEVNPLEILMELASDALIGLFKS